MERWTVYVSKQNNDITVELADSIVDKVMK